MVLESLSTSLRNALKKIANAPHVDRDLIKEVVRDLQRALLQADVNVSLVLSMSKRVEERALTEKPPAGMSSREHVIRIIYDEMVSILGEPKDLHAERMRIMMVGLYGQGKTTTIAKIGRYFQKKGLKVGLISGDTHRPAAYEQLKQLADSVSIPVFGIPGETKAAKVVRAGLEEFREMDVIIIDTSGRHSLEEDLIEEIKIISNVSEPDERLLVIDAAMGQTAGPQARAFNEAIGITGVVITKLDGSAKGGGALSAVAEIGAPVVFIGTGEHLDDLEHFDPPRFISRLLGMGDIRTLLERAQEVVEERDAEEIARKIMTGKFSLKDMYEQMEMLTRMGPIKKLLSLLPAGMTGPLESHDLEETQRRLRKFKVIMDSMTEEELQNPRIIKSSRVMRIARGSGTDPKDVKDLLKYYNMSRKAIKGFTSNRKLRKAFMKQLRFPEEG